MPKKNGPPRNYRSSSVAVIGMAGKFPGARNIRQFWENLKNGTESISRFSDQELIEAGISPELLGNPNYVKAKGMLEDADCFDAGFFSYPPRDAERMDPQMRLLHECSWEALETAGYNPETYQGRIGAYFGASENLEWIEMLRSRGANMAEDFDHFLLNYRDYVSTRISYKLNLKGPSFTLLAACSTSLLAIHLAAQSLLHGECDMAVAGGVSLMYPEKSGYIYQEGLMLSSDGHCRAFDEKADGTVFSDGIGVVVLKTTASALKDRDQIRALILGSAANNDGNGKIAFTVPTVDGQYNVIRAAQNAAGVSPGSIGYVETHGTGTKAGDPVEIEALTKAFNSKRRGFCGIGSVKTNIGHVNIAAGVASFIKTVLALENRLIPPSLNFSKPNPDIRFSQSPFYVVSEPLPFKSKRPRFRSGVSAFGFGGTNVHIILEEAPRRKREGTSRRYQLLALSARTDVALQAAKENLAGYLKQNPALSLPDLTYSLACGRKQFNRRWTCVANDTESAVRAITMDAPRAVTEKNSRSVAFMFPGQGSQFSGMAEDLYRSEKIFKDTLDHCAGILIKNSGYDIRNILYPRTRGDERYHRMLSQTEITQPAVFVISYSLAKLLISWGIKPVALIGHSLGEFVAASIAGVFSLEDALQLVARRGKLMQQMPRGAMLAVLLPESDIMTYLGNEISLAAVNGPSLCVVSGAQEAVKKLKRTLRQEGIASQFLAASHAFHSSLMDPVLGLFARLTQRIKFHKPSIPVMSTVTGDWASGNDMAEADYWVRNLRQTVRFSSGIQKLLRETDPVLLEVGPGKTLSSLAKLHMNNPSGQPPLSSLRSPGEKRSDAEVLLSAVGKLWCSGLDIDWEIFYSGEKRCRIELPTYPFERHRYRTDPPGVNHGRISSWTQLTKKQDIAEWFYIPSWKRSVAPHIEPAGEIKRMRWLVFADSCGVGRSVIERLRGADQDVVVLYRGDGYEQLNDTEFVLNPGKQAEYEMLFSDLSRLDKLPQNILHLWTITPEDQNTHRVQVEDKFQNLSFFSLLYLSQIIGTHNITDEVRISIVSNNLHVVTGSEEVDPWKATMLGPVKVIPQEYPNISCRSLDIELSYDGENIAPELSEIILTEAATSFSDLVVAYRGRHRWVQVYERVRLEPSLQKNFKPETGKVYLITGGLGGIGLVLAEYLGKAAKVKLVLIGRSEFPARSQWDKYLETNYLENPVREKIDKLRDIEKSGSEVLIINADVTDQPNMEAAISLVKGRFGKINGVIHAAGLHGEGIIQLKKSSVADSILAPKIKGTLVLDSILNGIDLDFFVLCSSIASVLGGIGLVDYCAANAFMDAFAAQNRRGRTGSLISINWDMWGEVGMGLKTRMPDELKQWLEKELRDGITSKEGVDVFGRILGWNKSENIIVSTRDLQGRIDLWIKREFIKEKEYLLEDDSSKPRYNRPQMATEYEPPQTDPELKIAAIWGRLFGIDKIGRYDNFYELGGHSLLATTLVNKLKKEFSTNISIRDILDNPTVRELASVIVQGEKKKNP